MNRHPLIALLSLAAIASTAQAQTDLLKGPEIQSTGSIVRHSMTGQLEQVEGRPEMAAFALVAKDPTLLDQAIDIELQRTVNLAMLLIDQIDLMKESTDASLAGDTKKAQAIQSQLHELFDPTKPHDPLSPQLLKLLDGTQAQTYNRILDQYWQAWIDATLKDRKDSANPAVRTRVQARLTTRLFNRELTEAYNISLKQYRDAMQAIYTAIDPTDEQRESIRNIIIAYIKQTKLDPTPEQRRQAMLKIHQMLDDQRQERLFNYLLKIVVPDEG